jgi:hypothetical protein
MMEEPNPDNPVDEEITQQFKENPKKFQESAKEWTKKYATGLFAFLFLICVLVFNVVCFLRKEVKQIKVDFFFEKMVTT